MVPTIWAQTCSNLLDGTMPCETLHARLLSEVSKLRAAQAKRCGDGTFYAGPTELKFHPELAKNAFAKAQEFGAIFEMTGMMPDMPDSVFVPVDGFVQQSSLMDYIGNGFENTPNAIAFYLNNWKNGADILPLAGRSEDECEHMNDPAKIIDCSSYVRLVASVTTHIGCGVYAATNNGNLVNVIACRLAEGVTNSEKAIYCEPYPYCHLEPTTPCSAPCGGGTHVWRPQPPSCTLPATETRPCNLHPCQCTYTEWWPVTPCSEPCRGSISAGYRREARMRLEGISDHCTDVTRVVECVNIPCDRIGLTTPELLGPHILANPANAPALFTPGTSRGTLPALFATLPPEVPMAALGVHLVNLPALGPVVRPAIEQANSGRNPSSGAGSPVFGTPLLRLPSVFAETPASEFENASAFGPCVGSASPPALKRYCAIPTWASFPSAIESRAVFHCASRSCDMPSRRAAAASGSDGSPVTLTGSGVASDGAGDARGRQVLTGAQWVVEVACPISASCCQGSLQALVCNGAEPQECACNGQRVPCPRCQHEGTLPEAQGGGGHGSVDGSSVAIFVSIAVSLGIVCCLVVLLAVGLCIRRLRQHRFDACEAYDEEPHASTYGGTRQSAYGAGTGYGAGSAYIYDHGSGSISAMDPITAASVGALQGASLVGGPRSPPPPPPRYGVGGATVLATPSSMGWFDGDLPLDGVVSEGPHFVHPRNRIM